MTRMGYVIEVVPADIEGEAQITCVDLADRETCVITPAARDLPPVGAPVWWSAGRIHWDRARRSARIIGRPFDPREAMGRWPEDYPGSWRRAAAGDGR